MTASTASATVLAIEPTGSPLAMNRIRQTPALQTPDPAAQGALPGRKRCLTFSEKVANLFGKGALPFRPGCRALWDRAGHFRRPPGALGSMSWAGTAAHERGARPEVPLYPVRPLRNRTIAMKHLFLLFFSASVLVGCRTPDYTRVQSSTCEVHHVTMFKRAVPVAHGMIPMSRVEEQRGEWKRRMDYYPHPGDCKPATNVVLPGETGRVVVYVCKNCETAMKQMKTQNP